MVIELRQLNTEGIRAFREYLDLLKTDPARTPPVSILQDPKFTADIADRQIQIELVAFKTRMQAADFLHALLAPLPDSQISMNVGFWSWLSLFYFDLTCPPSADHSRTPGREYRHILDKDYRYAHRHLLAGPYTVYQVRGTLARITLCTPIHVENHFHHQLASRQSLISNPAIIEAIDLLYFDMNRGSPKHGSQAGKVKPGSLIRFVSVIQQLDVTYDLYSMTAKQILRLLPSEFDSWKKA